MSNDLNLCQFIGRLGRDPETRYTAGGEAVTSFSLAVGWMGKDKEGVEWVRCVAFGKLAELAGQYLAKGKQCYVAGRFKTRKFEKDGQDHYTTEVNADTIQFLGGASESSEPRPVGGHKQADVYRKQGQKYKPGPDEDADSIPF
jgi:single-strand DNA-binding protein